MRKYYITMGLIAVVLFTSNLNLAVSQTPQQATADAANASVYIPGDTPIRLRLSQNLSSATAKVDEKVDFEVVEEVKVRNVVVIQQGATAIATVTEAKTKKSFGRAGKLNVNIDYVRLANGDKVALRAVKGGSGGSHTGAMTGAVVATAIVFFPAAPLFFFIKGKNIVIPKGTEITAFVAADTPIDPARFGGTEAGTSTASTPQTSSGASGTISGLAKVLVKSSPDACDITVDGKFVGSTTSTLQLTPGDHTILIEKAGFKSWQRIINVTTNGSVTIDATLDKIP